MKKLTSTKKEVVGHILNRAFGSLSDRLKKKWIKQLTQDSLTKKDLAWGNEQISKYLKRKPIISPTNRQK
jgi:hypothetical protein